MLLNGAPPRRRHQFSPDTGDWVVDTVEVKLGGAADKGAMRECYRCKVSKVRAGRDAEAVWHTGSRNFFAKRFLPDKGIEDGQPARRQQRAAPSMHTAPQSECR